MKLGSFAASIVAASLGITHIHLGRYTPPTATRDLAGVVTSPVPMFWGIDKE